MKVYKYQNKNNFIREGLSELRLFEYYDSPRISKYFDHYQQFLVDSSRFEMPVNPVRGDYNSNELQQYNLKVEFFEISSKPRKKFFHTTGWKDRFSLERKNNSSLECEYLSHNIRREDLIRDIRYPAIFVYLNIPHEFLLDNLTTHLGEADLRKVYKELEKVDLSDFIAILEAFKKGDKKYGTEIKKVRDKFPPEKVHSWRWDIYPDMINSIHTYGYGFPVMNGGHEVWMFDGSHRLATAPIVKKDYPILQLMPKGYRRGKDRSFFMTTPAYFNDDQVAIFEVDIDRKKVGGWFVHKDVIDFGKAFDSNMVVMHPVRDSLILGRIKSLEYDFKFVY